MANPFEQMSQGFNEGISQGMDFASRAAALEFQQEQFQFQKSQADESRKQWKMQVGQNLLQRMGKVLTAPSGSKVKKTEMELLKREASLVGVDVHEINEAAMMDEGTGMEILKAHQLIMDPTTPIQMKERAYQSISEVLRAEDLIPFARDAAAAMNEWKRLQDTQAHQAGTQKEGFKHENANREDTQKHEHEKLDKQLSASYAEEELKTASTSAKQTFELGKEFRETSQKIHAKYTSPNQAAHQILKFQWQKASPMDQVNMLKGFNGFFDTPRVTEGEVEVIQNAKPLRGVIDNWINQVMNGKPLTDDQVSQIVETTKKLKETTDSAQRDALQPAVTAAINSKLKLEGTFTPYQLGLFPELAQARSRKKGGEQAAAAVDSPGAKAPVGNPQKARPAALSPKAIGPIRRLKAKGRTKNWVEEQLGMSISEEVWNAQ